MILDKFKNALHFYIISSCVQHMFVLIIFSSWAFGTACFIMPTTHKNWQRLGSNSPHHGNIIEIYSNKLYHDNTFHPQIQFNSQSQSQSKPDDKRTKRLEHVAIICDGNSRWAAAAAATAVVPSDSTTRTTVTTTTTTANTFHGHARGASRVLSLLRYIHDNYSDTIRYVTLYGFSSENWSRPHHEIRDIWKVMEETAESVKEWVVQKEYLTIKILGDVSDDRIPFSLRKTLLALVETTGQSKQQSNDQKKKKTTTTQNESNKHTLTLCIAINYGGRNDILNATKRIVELVEKGEIKAKDVNSDLIDGLLGTAGMPDPDLVIRTGGEQRLSNFLIWNIAYSELYFTPVLWPDFDEHQFELALDWYYGRERRFGGRDTR